MFETPFNRTVGDWEAEFHRARDRRPLSATSEQLQRCRQRFSDISGVTRRQVREIWQTRPEFSALQSLSRDGLLLTRLAHQELAKSDAVDGRAVCVDLLEQLLQDTQSRLSAIDAQWQLIDSTLALAELLRPVIEGVMAEDGFPAHRLEPLLHRLDSRSFSGDAERFVPWPGVSFERILEQAGWPEPWFYAHAIHSARWIAAVRGGLPENDSYPRSSLIAAALLADVGLLNSSLVKKGRPFRDEPRAAAAFQRHPEISAAVISGLQGASSEWALLAGLHHERLDGTGFPSRYSGRQLSPAVRGFTAALRWSELLLQTSTARSPAETLQISAQALWRETERGAFGRPCVLRMFAAVNPVWAAAPPKEGISAALLLDPPHALPGPHHALRKTGTTLKRSVANRN